MPAPRLAPVRPRHDGGFTLVEVLVAMVVLIFGIIAISNLFVIATSSDVVARHMTASAAQAADAMEALKSLRFDGLAAGGPLDLKAALNTGAASNHQWTEQQMIQVDTNHDGILDNYEADRAIAGVGTIRVRWQIQNIDNQTRVIRVLAGDSSPALRGRSQVELVTYRSCTSPARGCPANP